MSTNFESTNSDYANPVNPSSPQAMSTNFVSTNSDFTDSFTPSLTQEHSVVWSRSSTISVSSSLSSSSDTTVYSFTEYTTLNAPLDNENRTVANETSINSLVYSVLFSLVPALAALVVLIIIAVLITVRKRRRRRKAHSEGNEHHFELGARQPIIENEKRTYENQRDYLKTLNRGIPDCQIYDKANDFDVRSKEPTRFEAEYDYAMATTSFLKPDQQNPSSNSALKITMAKRAKMLRTSLHFLQGQFSKQKSEKENVAYCDTAIVHTKFLYDTPQQSIKHVNKP
ncbi:uncharacterized protein LOC127709103 [Mytilus californianus]|uniref:uncharacterized protein LOC127709103 n=1 Tax=Mytilus californianus TaxID=6549 RepID=UPI00224703EC|nr:uncharacterized protein LOC127709103 [Mytilus californianus]